MTKRIAATSCGGNKSGRVTALMAVARTTRERILGTTFTIPGCCRLDVATLFIYGWVSIKEEPRHSLRVI